MKKVPIKKRFLYWFDNQMAGGSLALIRLLALVTLIVVLLISVVIFRLGLAGEEGFLYAFWESLSTVINAWMPSFEDGGLGYIILMSLAALVGLLITSVLIGIFSNAIEEKINSLKRGTSEVLEEGHTVVLGFYPGEYTLLKQLVLSAADDPCCIVVAGDMEQEEMQAQIRENIEIPGNVRIVCRTLDIFDPTALRKCAVASCRSVIISPTDDFTTTKALLAVSVVLGNNSENNVRVGAIVSRAEYRFPPSIAQKYNVTTLQTSETLAKIIAHSCTQPGLAETFREMFNFEGSELYLVNMPEANGLSFKDLLLRIDGGAPVGIEKKGGIIINPGPDMLFEDGDRLLVFSEEDDTSRLTALTEEAAALSERMNTYVSEASEYAEGEVKVTVIGGGSSLQTVLEELPDNVSEVMLCNVEEDLYEAAQTTAETRQNMKLSSFSGDPKRISSLLKIAAESEHIVILSDHEMDEDEADMNSIFLLLNLRDIRTRYELTFNITVEMRREANQNLIGEDDVTDFVVVSNMSSLFLAQLSESPELMGAFRELLSNDGNELYLKPADRFGCTGEKTTAEIRMLTLMQGYVMIGYLRAATNESVFNPPLHEKISLEKNDKLIVIGIE